jgi:hypothetical protein
VLAVPLGASLGREVCHLALGSRDSLARTVENLLRTSKEMLVIEVAKPRIDLGFRFAPIPELIPTAEAAFLRTKVRGLGDHLPPLCGARLVIGCHSPPRQ